MNKQWVNFYSPDGKKLCSYTVKGTFKGEAKDTAEILAAEHGCRPEEIKIKVEGK